MAEERWRDKPGDWWIHHKDVRKRYRKRGPKPKKVTCANCNRTISTNTLMVHQRSTKCQIATRERQLEDKGYVKYRNGTNNLELARLQVVVADRSIWVPRWLMITIHSLHKSNWTTQTSHPWAYREAFAAVSADTARQQLIERIATRLGSREVVPPNLLLTLRKCDMVLEHVLNGDTAFSGKGFKQHIANCANLIDKFPNAPLSEHMVLAVSAAISHKLVRAKLKQRPQLKHSLSRSKVTLDAVLRRIGGRDAVRPYLEEPWILDD